MNEAAESFPDYEKILQMTDDEKAVNVLFERAKREYEKLFSEMALHEKNSQQAGSPPADCGGLFLGEAGERSLSLYLDTRNVLGQEGVIKSDDNIFFNPMFYKFCSDYKRLHGVLSETEVTLTEKE